jgi:hypothetical protein
MAHVAAQYHTLLIPHAASPTYHDVHSVVVCANLELLQHAHPTLTVAALVSFCAGLGGGSGALQWRSLTLPEASGRPDIPRTHSHSAQAAPHASGRCSGCQGTRASLCLGPLLVSQPQRLCHAGRRCWLCGKPAGAVAAAPARRRPVYQGRVRGGREWEGGTCDTICAEGLAEGGGCGLRGRRSCSGHRGGCTYGVRSCCVCWPFRAGGSLRGAGAVPHPLPHPLLPFFLVCI